MAWILLLSCNGRGTFVVRMHAENGADTRGGQLSAQERWPGPYSIPGAAFQGADVKQRAGQAAEATSKLHGARACSSKMG